MPIAHAEWPVSHAYTRSHARPRTSVRDRLSGSNPGAAARGAPRLTLAQVMLETGASCLASGPNAFRNLLIGLDSATAFTESEIADAVAMMARTACSPNAVLHATTSIWGASSSAVSASSAVPGSAVGAPPGSGLHPLDSKKNASGQQWDVKTFVAVIGAINPQLDWALVFRSLDTVGFFIADQRSLELVVSVHQMSRVSYVANIAMVRCATRLMRHAGSPMYSSQWRLSGVSGRTSRAKFPS